MSKTGIFTEATRAVSYKDLTVTSQAFQDAAAIPVQYTGDGRNISPPLDIKGIPAGSQSLVLLIEDPDAGIAPWLHWVVWNIPVAGHLKENDVHGTEGMNDFQEHRYRGPCPPSGTHRYVFKVYALDALLDLPPFAKKIQVERAMSEHIIAFGELTGCYKRRKESKEVG